MVFHLGVCSAAHSNRSTITLSAGSAGIDPGVLRHVLLQDVVLHRALQLLDRHALTLGRRDVEAEQHRGGAIDRHRGGDAVERNPVEERLHVGEARDGDAALADLALRPRMVGVVAHERRESRRRPRGRSGPAPAETCSARWCPRRCRSRRTGAWSRAGRGTWWDGCRGCTGYSPGSSVAAAVVGEIERGVDRLDDAPRDRGEFAVLAHRQRRRRGAPGGDLGPQPVSSRSRRQPRAVCVGSVQPSCARTLFQAVEDFGRDFVGARPPAATSSSRSRHVSSAPVSSQTQRRVARSTTSRVRSRSRRAAPLRSARRCGRASRTGGRAPRRSSATPSPFAALVEQTGWCQASACATLEHAPEERPAGRRDGRGTCRNALPLRMPSITSISWRSFSAPGRSALFTTNTIGDFHDPGLERLDAVARFWDQHEDGRVGDPRHIQLRLADANGLDENAIEAGGVERGHRLRAWRSRARPASRGSPWSGCRPPRRGRWIPCGCGRREGRRR